MADIILAGDSFSLKKLRNAAEQLEDAQNLMQKAYDAVYSTGFWAEANPFALLDGSKNMNVFDGTIDELNAFQQRVHQKEETLRTLAQRIEAAVRELAETDQSFRGKLSGENGKTTWERITGAARSVGQTASAAAVSLIGAINGLFSSDDTVAGETRINGFTQEQIANAYMQFDWTDIEPTDEEIDEITLCSKNETDLLKQFEILHTNAMGEIKDQFGWETVLITENELMEISGQYSSAVNLKERYTEIIASKRNIKNIMDATIADDIGKDGDKYWDWYYGYDQTRADSYCALFAAYHMGNAGIDLNTPTTEFNQWVKTHPETQANYFKEMGAYHQANSGYVPKTGDIVYIDWSGGNTPNHVGMIYIGKDGTVKMLHGNNSEGKVQLQSFDYPKQFVVGYGDTKALYQKQNET